MPTVVVSLVVPSMITIVSVLGMIVSILMHDDRRCYHDGRWRNDDPLWCGRMRAVHHDGRAVNRRWGINYMRMGRIRWHWEAKMHIDRDTCVRRRARRCRCDN